VILVDFNPRINELSPSFLVHSRPVTILALESWRCRRIDLVIIDLINTSLQRSPLLSLSLSLSPSLLLNSSLILLIMVSFNLIGNVFLSSATLFQVHGINQTIIA
jgi:hypothetical protein